MSDDSTHPSRIADMLALEGRDRAAAAAQHAVDSHADEWLSKGVSKARGAIAERLEVLDQERAERAAVGAEPPRSRTLERAGLRLAAEAVDGVEEEGPALLELGRDAARRVLIHITSGDAERARLAALAGSSTFRARREASATSTDSTVAMTQRRAEATERVLKKAGELGLAALERALPFLLSAL